MYRYFNFIYFKLKNFILIPFILKDFILFKKKNNDKKNRFKIHIKDFYPCVGDKTALTNFDTHYIYHPAWAARILAKTKPKLHIDISSTLYFCSIVSAFIPVKFFDYRPAKLELDNFESERADILSLPFEDNSVKSLSCMHTIEHIGLGRYGEPIDPDGDLKAIKELKRILAKGGSLLFVVPIGGRPKIHFNAHRVYSYNQIMEYFSDFKLKEFTLVAQYNKEGGFIRKATKEMADKEKYGCGCFWFVK